MTIVGGVMMRAGSVAVTSTTTDGLTAFGSAGFTTSAHNVILGRVASSSATYNAFIAVDESAGSTELFKVRHRVPLLCAVV